MKKNHQTTSARVLFVLTRHRQATASEIRFAVYRDRPPKNARSLIWNILRRFEATGLAKRLIRRRCGRNPGTIWTAID